MNLGTYLVDIMAGEVENYDLAEVAATVNRIGQWKLKAVKGEYGSVGQVMFVSVCGSVMFYKILDKNGVCHINNRIIHTYAEFLSP